MIVETASTAPLLIPALAGGKMVATHSNHVVKHLVLIALTGGCFYTTDPVNQRPSLEIVNASSSTITRGQKDVTLRAVTNDPEGQFVALHWRLYICDDANNFDTCDQVPAIESSSRDFVFDAPVLRKDPDGIGPVTAAPAKSLRVDLEGTDDLGATARPSQELIIPLGDGVPTLDVQHDSKYETTLGTPISVFTVYGDPDDPAASVTLGFNLFSPMLSAVTLADFCTPQPGCLTPADPLQLEVGKTFTPDKLGEWKVEVTATDPVGMMPGAVEGKTTVIHSILVVADRVPCIGEVDPLAPPSPTTLPLGDPTLFQIHNVDDALDPFPSDVNDPVLGTTQFHWSLEVNGGPRVQLDTEAGNSFAFDPANFIPGDLVEVRAEIADHVNPFPLAAGCDPTQQTCSLDTSRPACIQRQSWTVEIR